MIKGIIFDLDDTLIDFSEEEERVEKEISGELAKSYELNPELVYSLLVEIRAKHRRPPSKPRDNSRFVWFSELFNALNINEDALKWEKTYWDRLNSRVKLFPNVIDTLRFLKSKNLMIALLTDSDGRPEFKDERINKVGLTPFVDVIVKSDEVGINKPDKKLFLFTLKRMGLNPDEVVMVGDDPPLDLVTAKELGLITVWKRNKPMDGLEERKRFIDYVISDISELVKILNL